MRERGGRTMTFVTKSEDAAVPMIHKMVEPGSVIHADEATHWDKLAARFETKRINHSESYSAGGACTNMAESFFSRLRRMELGTHHHISGAYLAAYAAEADWREDNRRISNGEQYLMVAAASIKHCVSAKWAGYWQRSAA